jgi:N-carbamoyl-L-amino-acid hydrolase
LRDSSGQSLEEIRESAGMRGDLSSVQLAEGAYSAFVELHIEQGPLLERAKVPIGIVESIAAPASFQIVIEGSGGHAGAVLMPDRQDALCAAAEIISAVEDAARSTGALDTVATIGICEVFPGAINSIPSRARLTLDARDTDLARRDAMLQVIRRKAEAVSAQRRVAIRFETINSDAPATCSPAILDALAEACRKHALPFQKMVSRAYHDSLFMSRIAPTAMLFIPCRNGFSHRPDEFAAPDDIARGTLVLAEVLSVLAG